jgi:hypothetical protein
MAGTTLQISNNMIVIQHEKTENSMYDDGDKQTIVILMPNLCGFNINHSKKIITLYLNIRGMESYTVDFTRGSTDQAVIKTNFTQACTYFGFGSN